MINLVLALCFHSLGPSVHIELRIPLVPEQDFRKKREINLTGLSWDPKSGCAILSIFQYGEEVVFWFDGQSRKLFPIGDGHVDESQIDCGFGLATIHRYYRSSMAQSSETYSLTSGKLISTVKGRAWRVGHILISGSGEDVHKYFDAFTSKLILEKRRGNDDPVKAIASLRTPIWISKKTWLFLISEEGKPHSDSKDVAELDPKTLMVRKRTPLSGLARGFDKIVGNPEIGPFAIFESTNRSSECTGVFQRDLSSIPGNYTYVTDISANGILHRGFKPREYIEPIFISVICADIKTGDQKWVVQSSSSGHWIKQDVLIGNSVYDGTTGKLRGRLKMPNVLKLDNSGRFLGIDGRMLVFGTIRGR